VCNKFFPLIVCKSTKQVHVCLCTVYTRIASSIRQAYIQTFFHIARFKEDQHTFERKKRFSSPYFVALSKMKICTHREKKWTTMKLKKRFGLTSNRYFVTLSKKEHMHPHRENINCSIRT